MVCTNLISRCLYNNVRRSQTFQKCQLNTFSSCTAGLPPTNVQRTPLAYKYLDTIPYAKALALQNAIVASRTATNGEQDEFPDLDILLLLQHPPTYTAGRRIVGTDATEGERLRKLGADYFETRRGGQTTFHGPGQLVGYPILNIQRMRLGVRCYVNALEEVMIRTCAHYGIHADRTTDTGVWVGNNKIAALGIQVQRHVTSHGFALNCDTDLIWYDHIVPCGLKGKGVTSVKKERGLARGIYPFVGLSTQSEANCRDRPWR
ncbi:hypothetical protein BC832DRAFT_527426 [Gaertneriomyces semiglobifer]|nr:hypothetical protein BC832DRAFT_527426 [Gaertneriomyces semiglobifer]